ncbi:uncharacterized abhydrolase domain-containing protein DDB_G0269086-like [Nycticebus coucang]|uniref:uncharacterized abhydrolase domain-containing protein DDB_G0269086-like n=1 Tax=Nycticebus coucang TaxID=9470 RepID=UPI00234D6F48|nr:uncharacterized abhydrolase domain-containing protein DDB_G0269086-like [Nycticebus coucang]
MTGRRPLGRVLRKAVYACLQHGKCSGGRQDCAQPLALSLFLEVAQPTPACGSPAPGVSFAEHVFPSRTRSSHLLRTAPCPRTVHPRKEFGPVSATALAKYTSSSCIKVGWCDWQLQSTWQCLVNLGKFSSYQAVQSGLEGLAGFPTENRDISIDRRAKSCLVEGEDLQQEDSAPVGEPHLEDDRFLMAPDVHDKSETLEPETFHEDSQDYHQDLEEKTYEQEAPDSSEPLVADGRLQHDEDGVTYQDYDEKVYEPLENEPSENEPLENEPLENEPLENEPLENEPLENEPLENEPLGNEPSENNPVENELSENEPSEKERIEISDTTVYSVEDSNVIAEEVTVPLVEEQQEVPPDT